jgi:hypothetical protein
MHGTPLGFFCKSRASVVHFDKKGKLAFVGIPTALAGFGVVWFAAVEAYDKWEAHKAFAKSVMAFFASIGSNPVSLLFFGLFALCAYVCRDDILHLWHRYFPPDEKSLVPFRVRPISGETLLLMPGSDIVARLAVINTSGIMQKQCSVRILGAYRLRNGGLWGKFPGMFPSVNPLRGESFLLRWAKSESATIDRKYLDIPSDGSERIAECLIAKQVSGVKGRAEFCAANSDDLPALKGISNGWWKICLRIASESGDAIDVELLAATDGDGPGITLDMWNPRGEQILAEQMAQRQSRKHANDKTDSHATNPDPAILKIEFDPQKHFTPRGDLSECRLIVRNDGGSTASRVKVKLESLVPLTRADEALPYSSQFNGVLLQVVREDPAFSLNAGEVSEVIVLQAFKGQDWFVIKGHNIHNEPADLETLRADYEITVVASAMNSRAATATFYLTNKSDGGISFVRKESAAPVAPTT